MHPFRLALLLASLAIVIAGCRRTPSTEKGAGNPSYATTIFPFRSILEPVSGKRGTVRHLLPAGSSPHTYDPRPSDARIAARARVLFYGAAELDAWGARLASGLAVELIGLLPDSMILDLPYLEDSTFGEHNHSPGRDPHFWMDPLTVASLLPALADTLCDADPEYCVDYRRNAAVFADRLDVLHDSVRTTLAPLAGRSVLLSHPFVYYLLDRYGIHVAGIVEEIPGSEPTARDMQRIVNTVRQTGADAILILPQLPDRAARAVSETLGIPLIELDPIGGGVRRTTYEDLILYNVHALRQALRKSSLRRDQ